MENRQRSHNEPQISINRFAGPAQRRRLPDSVRLPKRRRRRRRKIRNQLLFLSAALIVLIAVVILIVLVVRACSGGRTKTLDGKSTPDNTAVYSFEGAGSKRDTLCGKWDLDGTTVYVFDGKGRGALELPENKYDFRYKIKDGTVNIDFSDDKIRDISYKFTINSDELTLERKEKKDIVIHKFKKQTDNRYE